jgi:hypothetical protein
VRRLTLWELSADIEELSPELVLTLIQVLLGREDRDELDALWPKVAKTIPGRWGLLTVSTRTNTIIETLEREAKLHTEPDLSPLAWAVAAVSVEGLGEGEYTKLIAPWLDLFKVGMELQEADEVTRVIARGLAPTWKGSCRELAQAAIRAGQSNKS